MWQYLTELITLFLLSYFNAKLHSSESKKNNKGCFKKCGKKSGPCPTGCKNPNKPYCCKKGLVENGCDGNAGKKKRHTCVAKPGK